MYSKRITESKKGRKWIQVDFADNPEFITWSLASELLELNVYKSKLYKKSVQVRNELFIYCNPKIQGKGRAPMRFRYTF